MKDYVKLFIDKLNKLVNEHPNADVRYNTTSLNPACGCKCLFTDLKYDAITNTIYIG